VRVGGMANLDMAKDDVAAEEVGAAVDDSAEEKQTDKKVGSAGPDLV
jgi:hypothetical protein